jgi:hypothetical protein
MNYRKTLTYREVAQQAQKLSEMAYLEACQPKDLRNQMLVDYCFKEAKRLTNRLKNAGYWKNSVISLG